MWASKHSEPRLNASKHQELLRASSLPQSPYRHQRQLCQKISISFPGTTRFKVMAMNCIKSLRGGKGGGAADAPKASSLGKEVKSTTTVGANILKDGTDPKVLEDSEYPIWLWRLLDKRPALSELRRKNIETLPYEDLKRFVKLDNRARIRENNFSKAKN
ncbi:39S RIBOSOMAL PROTEIN L54 MITOCHONDRIAL [Salix koriyanagi]|uniref:Large ribosomal subunit protein mL54 n=1 Tax=Salix koriyanagi TaxID=2511006 RepID=A0A9Q0X1U0_9ROSI|nr:39S RIBOSOMAL PROTEIN L54 MITOCHONDRIAL [Salix koriyanagi]